MKRKITKNPENKKQITADIMYNLKKLKEKLAKGKFSLKELNEIDLKLATLV